jgi:hypothetical protein
MYCDIWQQLLIGTVFSIGVLSGMTLAEAGFLEQRNNARAISLKAADDANVELARGRAVLDAALNGTDPLKWSATPPDLSALLGDIGTGLALPPLPPATTPGEDLPSDRAVARNTISGLVSDIIGRRDLTIVLAGEPAFGSDLQGRLTSVEKKLVELSDGFARLGHKLAAPYADVLGYSDVDGVVSTYKPMLADLRLRAQIHGSQSKAIDQDLRGTSRPLLSIVLSLLQKEGLSLNDEKRALDDLAVSLAADAKKIQSEYEGVAAALETNNANVDALLARDRDLEAAAVAAAKKAEDTGIESDRDAAKAPRQELETFRQGLSEALTKLGSEKTDILARRDKSAADRDQLQKTAAAALARYRVFESQQKGHAADEGTLKGISF